MWKLIVGFIVFAGLALFVLRGAGNLDLGGEKHDLGAVEQAPAASAAASH